MKNYSLEQREVFDKPYYSVNVANLALLPILQEGIKSLECVKNVNISDGKRQHLTIYKQDFFDAKETHKLIKAYLDKFDDASPSLPVAPQPVVQQPVTTSQSHSDYTPAKPQYFNKPNECPTIFISHAWENETHKQWILHFAQELSVKYGINVWCDYYNTGGTPLTTFMAYGITNADRVLIIGTPSYKQKSESLDNNGVSFENMVISSSMYFDNDTTRFIPVLQSGTFSDSFNTMMGVRVGYDLSTPERYKENIELLARDIWNEPAIKKPERGTKPTFSKPEPPEKESTPYWLQLVEYAELTSEDFQIAYDTCWSQLKNGDFNDPRILAHIISTFAELDAKGIELSEESKSILLEKVTGFLYSFTCQDDLHDAYIMYAQTLNANGYDKGGTPFQQELLQLFYGKYRELMQSLPTKMTLTLEHLSNENVTSLVELHQKAPDHGTPYSMLTIFDKVDIDAMVASITQLSPASRNTLAKFFIDRYMLVYAITKMDKSVCDDYEGLKALQERIGVMSNAFGPIEKLSYYKLANSITSAMKRCAGDTNRLVE